MFIPFMAFGHFSMRLLRNRENLRRCAPFEINPYDRYHRTTKLDPTA
jgi:hypothetical protein